MISKDDASPNAVWDMSRSSPDIQLAMDEDETEWSNPSWCDWSRSYVDYQNAPGFIGADLRNADFTEARLALSEFHGADLRGAVLRYADLSFADFSETSLENADFAHADLCKTDFSRASMRNANFTGADLAYACLKDADLTGANLSGACLDAADLRGAKFDVSTELPLGPEEAKARGMVFGGGRKNESRR